MPFTASTYYYSSERSYVFGPFPSSASIQRFIDNDPTPDAHNEWHVEWLNSTKLYGTGQEASVDYWNR